MMIGVMITTVTLTPFCIITFIMLVSDINMFRLRIHMFRCSRRTQWQSQTAVANAVKRHIGSHQDNTAIAIAMLISITSIIARVAIVITIITSIVIVLIFVMATLSVIVIVAGGIVIS